MVSESAEEILENLAQPSNVSLRSDSELAGKVVAAAAHDDQRRVKKHAEQGRPKVEDVTLRRKPELQPIPVRGGESAQLTAWEVLHGLGQAIALSRRGAARGLAEHWGALKYSQALTGDTGSFLKLSAEGKDPAGYYKANQSTELGVGFGLALAQRILAQRHRDRVVSIVPADTVLRAGWALTSRDKGRRGQQSYSYRPQFFAELWKPDAPSLVLPIACKGNHSNAKRSHGQLASASAHVEAVHIGTWNETPAMVFSTELPLDGHITVHALCAEGSGGWLSRPENGDLDVEHRDRNHVPGIQPPANGAEVPSPVPGFHVTPKLYGWFGQVLAGTAAAGLTAFAGNGDATGQYLTERQGRKHFTTGFAHATTGSVQDAHNVLLGIPFEGTDHVFRLNKVRVEAFSGVEAGLLKHLTEGRVEQYRREIYSNRRDWPSVSWDSSWGGPVSVHPDGTVLAMRRLP